MKKESWVIIANSSHARLFKLENLDLIEMDSLIHPECRMHEKDLVADKPGATYEGVGQGRVSMEQQQSPKKREATLFAKQVAEHLDLARSKGEIDRVFIAASPSFLGLLRQEMNDRTAGLVAAEVDKDITSLKVNEIISYFPIGL